MLNYTIIKCVIIHRKKKAAGAGKDFTLFFGVMLHFNFKCVVARTDTELSSDMHLG